MKLNRSITIPAALAVYLAVMSYIGYSGYQRGEISALYYYGIIGLSIVILIILHFVLKRRDKLRRERLDDIERNQQD